MRFPMIWTSGPMVWCRESCRIVDGHEAFVFTRDRLRYANDGDEKP